MQFKYVCVLKNINICIITSTSIILPRASKSSGRRPHDDARHVSDSSGARAAIRTCCVIHINNNVNININIHINNRTIIYINTRVKIEL